ncbi:hypothetical protein [Shewanella sp. GXUN23E]|uniref:hypothetical protein n=1 Tax=Shewanella sp. GXUN23E TaxID=3422498 RepID=UPI003D7D1894
MYLMPGWQTHSVELCQPIFVYHKCITASGKGYNASRHCNCSTLHKANTRLTSAYPDSVNPEPTIPAIGKRMTAGWMCVNAALILLQLSVNAQ